MLIDLMNSWHIPNDSRVAEDQLDEWVSGGAWDRKVPNLPCPRDVEALRRWRDGLRALIEGDPSTFGELLNERDLVWLVDRSGVTVDGTSDQEPVELVLQKTVTLAQTGELRRVKSCSDCRWVFFDTSRNNSRVWCAMDAAPGRRGCGAIAKTRRYRERSRKSAGDDS